MARTLGPVTDSEQEGTAPPAGPGPLALAVAFDLVTRYRLRLADARDIRLGELAGLCELNLAAMTGDRAAFVGFFEAPGDGPAANAELDRRIAAARLWGRRRIAEQPAARCDILLVAVGPITKRSSAAVDGDGPVRVGLAQVDISRGAAEALAPIPRDLPGIGDLRRHARRLRAGAPAPTLAAVDLAERQTVAGGYSQPVRQALVATPIVTYALIGAFVAVFLAEKALIPSTMLDGAGRVSLFDFGALVNVGPQEGDWWRFISSAFLHDDRQMLHVLGNSMAMFFIGRLVEQLYGRIVLLGTFLLTAVAGGLTWMAATRLGIERPGLSIGASGGIAGLMGLLIMIGRFQGRDVPAGVAGSIRQWVATYVVLTILFGFVLANVNNSAHVGGFLAGVLLSLVLAPAASVGGRRLLLAERAVLIGVIAVSAVALGVAGVHLAQALGQAPAA